jgi:hypothetical protein
MKKTNLLSIKFEPLTEESESLLGGFSASLSASSFTSGSEANNCQGGNCSAGCGSGQEVNNIVGCGTNQRNCLG